MVAMIIIIIIIIITNYKQASLSNMELKTNMSRNHHQRHFLRKIERNLFNKCVESFLFLRIAVDSTLMCPIRAIASQSANTTKETMK